MALENEPAFKKVLCINGRTTLRRKSKPAGNKGFAIAGVPCFADTLVQGGSSVLRMKFSAKTPRLRKAAKRYAAA